MSFALNLIKRLKKAGYTEVSADTRYDGRLAHVVYLLADDGKSDLKFYQQSTRAIRSNFTKFQSFLKRGSTKHLPTPVANAMPYSFMQFPEYHVKAYYKKGIFTNGELIKQLTKEGARQLGAKERTSGPFVNVYKLSIKGDSRFKIVVSKAEPSKVVAQLVSKSKDQVYATYPTRSMNYRGWCFYNRDRMASENMKIETLATGLFPAAGKAWAKLYLDAADPTYVLNSVW